MNIIDLTAGTPWSVMANRILKIIWLILHDTSGPYDNNSRTLEQVKQDILNTIHWFQGSGGVSIHYLIGPEKMGAPIYRLVPESIVAYHAIGDGKRSGGTTVANQQSIGIEVYGYPTEPPGPAQTAALLWLVADIAARRGIPPTGVISHASIQTDRTDGKKLLSAARAAVTSGASSGGNNGGTVVTNPVLPYGATQDAAGTLFFPVNGKPIPIGLGFKDFFLTLGGNVPVGEIEAAVFRGVKLFGLPLEAEHTDPDGKARQRLQRSKFIYDPSQPDAWKVGMEFIS